MLPRAPRPSNICAYRARSDQMHGSAAKPKASTIDQPQHPLLVHSSVCCGGIMGLVEAIRQSAQRPRPSRHRDAHGAARQLPALPPVSTIRPGRGRAARCALSWIFHCRPAASTEGSAKTGRLPGEVPDGPHIGDEDGYRTPPEPKRHGIRAASLGNRGQRSRDSVGKGQHGTLPGGVAISCARRSTAMPQVLKCVRRRPNRGEVIRTWPRMADVNGRFPPVDGYYRWSATWEHAILHDHRRSP